MKHVGIEIKFYLQSWHIQKANIDLDSELVDLNYKVAPLIFCHFSVGSQLLQGWIWLVLANVRWRWWQPIRDHCFSGRVSLTATNITRPTLDFIEEIYHFWFTVSVFVHRARIEEEIVVWEKEEEIVVWKKKRSFVCIEEEKKASRASRRHNAGRRRLI